MTDYTEVRADAHIERDRWGRYVLPHPETGEKLSWTRATTVAGKLKDRYGLEGWKAEGVAYGIGKRPDLYARASAAKREDKSTLAEIVKQAEATAAAQSGANFGSAIHQFTERIDRGETIEVPAPLSGDVAAYHKVMEQAGIAVAVGWIERIVAIPGMGFGKVGGIAGTIDRLYNSLWRLPRIGDIKTATDGTDRDGKPYNKILTYGMVDIPIQLAIYANARYWWDGREWVEMPKVDLAKAMVAHVPVGLGECRLYEVDIAAGWEAVQLAHDVDEWHRRDDLFVVIPAFGDAAVGEPDAGRGSGEGSGDDSASESSPDPAACEVIRARVEVIKAHSDQARQWLAARWPVGIPTFPKGGPRTDAELGRIHEIVLKTEDQFSIARPGQAEEEEGRQPAGNRKGGEAPPAEDPPASDSSSAETDDPAQAAAQAEIDFSARKAWAAERVDAIKASDAVGNPVERRGGGTIDGTTPRKMLAGLWSSRDEIPTFPHGGPRDADELSMVLGWCETVEMAFELSFTTDPTAPPAEPGSARRKKGSR